MDDAIKKKYLSKITNFQLPSWRPRKCPEGVEDAPRCAAEQPDDHQASVRNGVEGENKW